MDCKIHGWNARQAAKDGKPLTMIDKVIMLRSDLTHSEFQFSERYYHLSFSSTGADGANGARFKRIHYTHPKRWVTRAIPLDNEQEDMLFLIAKNLADVGKMTSFEIDHACRGDKICQGANRAKYDYVGLMSFALEHSEHWYLNALRLGLWGWTAVIRPDPYKYWCSEICGTLIKRVYPFFNGRPDKLDPSALDEEIVRYFGGGSVMFHPQNWQPMRGEE